MAHQWLRANLASAVFPFSKDQWGRTVIIPGLDQNYDKTIASQADTDKDKGVPQAYYMHNCIPTGQGYQAVGYDTLIPGIPAVTDFDKTFQVTDPNNNKFLFSPAVGKNYVFNKNTGSWASISPIAPGVLRDDVLVTSAYIQGETYFYYANYGCYRYDPALAQMVPVTLTSLVAANILGICAANGYMIAWDASTVVWSSATTPTDFTPSLITGAGGGSVNDVKGNIICCLPISGGMIVYCEKNAVGGSYSGNIRFPFIFKEVIGSAGIISPESVSWQANLSQHYAWTTAGLQTVDKANAVMQMPELVDFLSNLLFEDFDEVTLLFTTTYLPSTMRVKVAVIGERYIIISYGINYPEFTHALLYDIAAKRWGKLKITHRDCFQWNAPNLFGALTYGMLTMTYGEFSSGTTYGDLNTAVKTEESPKKTIAFLQQDGTVKIVNFDLAQTQASGVLVIGKYQLQRNKWIVHQNVDIENVRGSSIFTPYLLITLDGKTFEPAISMVLNTYKAQGALVRRYSKLVSAFNVSYLFVGAFNLTSLIMDYSLGGST